MLRRRWFFICLGNFVGLLSLFQANSSWGLGAEKTLKLTVVPLRYHGLALVLETPSKEFFLVDTGGGGDAELLRTTLVQLGVKGIRGVVISHTHGDHQGGLPVVLQNFPVEVLYLSPLDRKTPESLRTRETEFSLALRRQAAERGVQVQEIFAGCRLEWDPEIQVDVLWPPEDLYLYSNPQPHGFYNSNSVVIRLQYGQRVLLLPGDLSEGAAAALVEREKDRLKADVHVVPHHGFFGLKEFAAAVSAEVAVASCIVDYSDHPTRNVPGIQSVQLFAPLGTRVYVTAWHGEITLKTEGSEMQVGSSQVLRKW